MSVEALTTSEIEGEMLNRASVQSSIQRQLGFISDRRKVQPAEQGISELMVDLYRGVDKDLTENQLFCWHRMVVSGRNDDVTKWLRWFSTSALEAQYRTFAQVDFVIHKAKLLDQLGERINARQKKVL